MVDMKTLTITDAKKNLGKWLNAAVRGEQVGIVSGATIVALQPVQVRAVSPIEIRELNYEYAAKEYGVTKKEFDAFLKRIDAEVEAAKREGMLVKIEKPTVENIEKAFADNARAPQATRSARPSRAGRRVTRAR
ncbi:MAG: hypothetical protein QOE70_3337 [Chthoniobacter sp.]|jgi:antitoxin (DNA-binding transcriptional repressor) of toxin-antitoxin stability system|nr:hypothetical protein [Chthoniobacter sp.]